MLRQDSVLKVMHAGLTPCNELRAVLLQGSKVPKRAAVTLASAPAPKKAKGGVDPLTLAEKVAQGTDLSLSLCSGCCMYVC